MRMARLAAEAEGMQQRGRTTHRGGMEFTRGVIGILLAAMTWNSHIFILLHIFVGLAASDSLVTSEKCQMESFNITCGHDEVILMRQARYGRMKLGQCVKRNLGYLGCGIDVLPYVDNECSGKRHCEFPIPNPTLYSTHPCPADTTPYLEATHECIKVAIGTTDECNRKHKILLSGQQAYIASDISREYAFGTSRCPWVIKVNPGQKIKISLFNFDRPSKEIPDLGNSRQDICYEFATVKEGGSNDDRSLTACGGEDRINIVHTSKSNIIEIVFQNPTLLATLGTYLIKYEAFGCSKLAAPKNGYIQENGETAMIRCNHTDETWYLTCQGTRWLGQTGNCSQEDSIWNFNSLLNDNTGFPYGILLVVAIGVALGVFIGGILLTLVVIYMKRRQRAYQESTSRTVEQGKDALRTGTGKYDESQMNTPQWDTTNRKYRGSDEVYFRDGTSFSTMERDSAFTGSSGYKTGTSESEYYDQDSGPGGRFRQHIYESPQFSQ